MKSLLVLILSLACTACIQLGGDVQPQHFYLLSPKAEAAGGNSAPLNLSISPIEFPSYLDRSQMVSRTPQNELVISANDRWGEPLQDNLLRVLKENLRRQLSGLQITSYPWQPETDEGGILLQLTVNQFDGIPGVQTRVDIRWALVDAETHRLLVQRHFLTQVPIGTRPADLVAGLSESLAQLSTAISTELKQLK